MNRVSAVVSLLLVGVLVMLTGCFQVVERSGATTPATVTATSTATSSLTATPATTRPPTPPPPSQLFLDVRGPAEGTTVHSDVVVAHGVTNSGTSVEINSEVTPVDEDGGFQTVVTLSSGVNVIEVVATDAQGNRETKVVTVTSRPLPPQPFFLLITQPEDQSVVRDHNIGLSGRTVPEAVVSVNGISISVDELGIFSTTVTLEPGPNIIDVVATNTDGKILSTVLAVIFRP